MVQGTMKDPLVCEDWSEAFSVCRERGRPLIASVGAEVCKIFPSGRSETVRLEAAPVADVPCGDDCGGAVCPDCQGGVVVGAAIGSCDNCGGAGCPLCCPGVKVGKLGEAAGPSVAVKSITFSLEDIEQAMEDQAGFCTECGAERPGCEPDACGYHCDECGADEVYGAEELVIMGMVV